MKKIKFASKKGPVMATKSSGGCGDVCGGGCEAPAPAPTKPGKC
jgi:hypothetical protein